MPYTHLLTGNFKIATELKYAIWDKLFYQLTLPFNMEAQTQTNWCWAATSKSVSHFYSLFSPWTQCKVASSELDLTCCTSPTPGACNVPWYLDRALERTENFISIQSGTITWDTIKAELQKGLVVGARIGWSGGGGHFMVIYGISKIAGDEYLKIDDPIYGKSVLPYNEFATNYQGSGSWTHTYFTKKRYYFMRFKDIIFNPVLLKPIPEIRPLIKREISPDVDTKNLEREPDYTLPHLTYVFGLNDIHSQASMPDTPVSLRILEFEKKEPVAIYEVSNNEEAPQLLQVQTSQHYFKQFDAALNRLQKDLNEEEPGEIRHLRVPALNIEATWLHYDSDREDKFILLRQFEDTEKRTFTEREFIDYLNRLKEQLGDMDDTKGA